MFLNVGKTFLRALAKDLGLRDVKVTSNAAGIAVSGECYLYGMWESSIELANMSYAQLLNHLLALKKDVRYERAA